MVLCLKWTQLVERLVLGLILGMIGILLVVGTVILLNRMCWWRYVRFG